MLYTTNTRRSMLFCEKCGLTGIAFGLLVRWPWGRIAVRAGGVAIAVIGCGFLFKLL